MDTSGNITTFGGKIVFDEPSIEQQNKGYLSVDRLSEIANFALREANYTTWVMVDRLDITLDDNPDLERNALRALFRAYQGFAKL